MSNASPSAPANFGETNSDHPAPKFQKKMGPPSSMEMVFAEIGKGHEDLLDNIFPKHDGRKEALPNPDNKDPRFLTSGEQFDDKGNRKNPRFTFESRNS